MIETRYPYKSENYKERTGTNRQEDDRIKGNGPYNEYGSGWYNNKNPHNS